MIFCVKCGNQASENAKFCPKCGCPIVRPEVVIQQTTVPQPPTAPSTRKKDSVLSTLAAVFAFFTITIPVGVILAIIDLAIYDKTKRHLGSYVAFVFCGMLVLLLVFKSGNENIAEVKQSNPTPAPITQTVVEEEIAEVDDGIIDFNADGCNLKYLRHEMAKNSIDDECLVVYFQFTNNSTENKSCLYTFDDKTFQNGVELDISYFLLDDVESNKDKEIKPGTTVEVYYLYELRDESDVELEVSEWMSFSDEKDVMLLEIE